MMILELILTKQPSEWTDQEWEIVRDAIKDGKVTVDELKKFDFRPPTYPPPIHWVRESGGFGFNNAAVRCNEQPCQIQEFFKRHPDTKVAMISCSCPRCATYC